LNVPTINSPSSSSSSSRPFKSTMNIAKRLEEETAPPHEETKMEEGVLVLDEEDQEECRICYDDFPSSDFFSLASCNHSFCRNCLESHVRYNIRQVPIICPKEAETDCCGFLSMEEIKNLLPDAEFLKYNRIYRMHQDPSLIQCPRCDELSANAGGTDDDNPMTTCVACNHVYCKLHGDAHDPSIQLCIEFDKQRNDRHNRKSVRAIRKLTKPCSHCEAPIIKYTGCNHVVCTACNQDMCWRCATHKHMTGRVLRTCNKCNSEYVDHRHLCAANTMGCLVLTPICIIYMMIVFPICFLVSGFCCGCLACGTMLGDGETLGRKKSPWLAFQWLLFIWFLPIVGLVRLCGLPICQEKWQILVLEEYEAEEQEHDTSSEMVEVQPDTPV